MKTGQILFLTLSYLYHHHSPPAPLHRPCCISISVLSRISSTFHKLPHEKKKKKKKKKKVSHKVTTHTQANVTGCHLRCFQA